MHLEALIADLPISSIKKQKKKKKRGSNWISANGFKVVFILREIHNIRLLRGKWRIGGQIQCKTKTKQNRRIYYSVPQRIGSSVRLPTLICNPLRPSEIVHRYDGKFEETSSVAGLDFGILRLRSTSKCGQLPHVFRSGSLKVVVIVPIALEAINKTAFSYD